MWRFAELCQQGGPDFHAGVLYWFAAVLSVPDMGTKATEAQATALWNAL